MNPGVHPSYIETTEIEASKGAVHKNSKFHLWEKTPHGVFVNNFLTEQARRSRLVAY